MRGQSSLLPWLIGLTCQSGLLHSVINETSLDDLTSITFPVERSQIAQTFPATAVIRTQSLDNVPGVVKRDPGTDPQVGEPETSQGMGISEFPSSFSSPLHVDPEQIGEIETRAESLASAQITFTRFTGSNHKNQLKIHLRSRKFTREWSPSLFIGLVVAVVIIAVVYWMEAFPTKLQEMAWKTPTTTIFTLGLLTYITVSLLQSLIFASCNILRWRLCARPVGISFLAFIALGNVGTCNVNTSKI